MSDNFTGLSILIPIYNCDIRIFIREIAHQASELQIPFEIIAFDDFSNSVFKNLNTEIKNFKNVIYQELEKNHGRSAIRNLLADKSLYSHLLFLDCDGKVIKQDYIKKYLKHLDYEVIVGGRVYSKSPPPDINYLLHWKTGKQKEEIDAPLRNQNPFESLMFNNILIQKSIYNKIRLDETINGYGHEDSLFGYELKNLGCTIIHINNPIEHWQLDTNEAFLSKAETAIRNFTWLIKIKSVGKETKLYKSYMVLKKIKLISIYQFVVELLLSLFKNNLKSSFPFIPLLDIIKLYWLVKEMQKVKSGTIPSDI